MSSWFLYLFQLQNKQFRSLITEPFPGKSALQALPKVVLFVAVSSMFISHCAVQIPSHMNEKAGSQLSLYTTENYWEQ